MADLLTYNLTNQNRIICRPKRCKKWLELKPPKPSLTPPLHATSNSYLWKRLVNTKGQTLFFTLVLRLGKEMKRTLTEGIRYEHNGIHWCGLEVVTISLTVSMGTSISQRPLVGWTRLGRDFWGPRESRLTLFFPHSTPWGWTPFL